MAARKATVTRDTLETQITVSVNLDGSGKAEFDTGIPFLEHMLDQVARHGMVDLTIKAKGDLHIDDHHTVEDCAIVLGEAFLAALGERRGIERFGEAYVAMDEALEALQEGKRYYWHAVVRFEDDEEEEVGAHVAGRRNPTCGKGEF